MGENTIDAELIVLSKREQALIDEWRKNPDGQAIIVGHDLARFMKHVTEYRNQARRNQIGPQGIVNWLSLKIGIILEQD